MSTDDNNGIEAARSELVSFARRLKPDGLVVGTAGNLSVRLGEVVVITPSAVPYDALTPSDVCVLRLNGTRINGSRTISSEWPLHQAIYASTGAHAIVHTHSPEVVALSATQSVLPAVHYAVFRLGGPLTVVGYSRFGSDRLAHAVALAMSDRMAAILQNHGAVARGASLREAYDRAVLVEWLAGVYRRALQYGKPRVLSAEELADVLDEARRRGYDY
jgi:L-fuculose-phosphate aldolase